MTTDCLFCKIVAGEIPSTVVLQNDEVYAFRDIAPHAPTHVLIVPRVHIDDIRSVTADHGELLASMFAAASQIAAGEGIDDSGYRLSFNVGPDAGQTVFHLHLHLVGGKPLGGMAG